MPLAHDQSYELEKSFWTERDFANMGWHDVRIHAIAFDSEKFELLMDIDYMFAWADPAPGEKHYTFWMAPCTLVFSSACMNTGICDVCSSSAFSTTSL